MHRSLVVLALVAVTTIVVACSGSDDVATLEPATGDAGEVATSCGSPDNPCPPFGVPVTLDLVAAPTPGATPVPGYRAAVLPGDRVDVTLREFLPEQTVEVLSTHPVYDGVRYVADDEGVVRFPVDTIDFDFDSGRQEHSFIVLQPGEAFADARLASFMIVQLDQAETEAAQQELLRSALDALSEE